MISAIVLAAGSSSRMGDAKPLLSVGGRPLLDRVLSSVRDSRVDDIVVVLGHAADRIRANVSLDGARAVVNDAYADGMSTSIRAGLRAVDPRSDGFLIVLADQPFVSPATLDALIARRQTSRADILVPTYRGVRGNPVLLARSVSAEIDSITGDQGCRAIFGQHVGRILEVPVEDPGILIDLDTPDQVVRADEAIREGQPIDCLLGEIGHPTGHVHSEAVPDTAARVDVLTLAQELQSRREPFVLATVVRVQRPSSGRPGFKAIVRANRELIGWLGGSCAQSVLVAESLRALRDGRPRLMRLTPDAGSAPPEEGVVEYVMECESGGTMDIYVEPHLPRPVLLVVGDSPVAQALIGLGASIGFRVVLAAPEAAASRPGVDHVARDLAEIPGLITPDTYAVVATMGKYDESALVHLAGSPAAYVGLVASRRRAASVLEGLAAAGVPASARDRIRTPAGLDLAAETPEEIALSIAAEIVRVRRTSSPVELPVSQAPAMSAAMERDVVCGMEVPSDSPLRTTNAGRTFVFCSEGCLARFRKSPETFLT